MDAVEAVLIALGLLLLLCAGVAAPVLVLVALTRQGPRQRIPPDAVPRGPVAWTDDDEIEARRHR